jgi:hypothetical protein
MLFNHWIWSSVLADNELSQTTPAIHDVGTPPTVGADLSRTSPIDRPCVDVAVSG